jgi:AraC-like DNA-binding protein
MRFDFVIPCDILKPFIKTFAIQEAEEERSYKVLPDTNIVIGFQYKGRLSVIENLQETKLATAGITGLTDRYKVFKNSGSIGSVLVYFRETGARAFFKQPLHELFQESISLENFILRSELLVLEEQLNEARTDQDRIKIVEQFLIARMTVEAPDKLVAAALALIHQHKGNIRIAVLAQQLHTSQSPLEKRFRQTVGTSAKKFAAIVRLKHTFKNFTPGKSLTELGYEAGFYDQAHFIKEFRSFTGESPSQYFASGTT